MKTRKKRLSRWTALMLSLLLLFSMMVPTGFAVENDSGDSSAVVTIDGEGDGAASDSPAPGEENTGTDTSMTSDEAAPDNSAPNEGDGSANSSTAPGNNEPDSSAPNQEGDPESTTYIIAAFADSEITVETKKGTLEEVLALLPAGLEATLEDGGTVTVPVTWECADDYEATEYGIYTFDPVLPDGYELAEGLTDWDMPYVTVTIVDESDFEETGSIPWGRSLIDWSSPTRTAYLYDASEGLPRATIGSSVYIAKGRTISYNDYSTHLYTASADNGTYTAFCAEPAKSSPSGYFTVSKIGMDSEAARVIKGMCLIGYGGPLYGTYAIFSDDTPELTRYAYTHAVIGYAYCGDTNGFNSDLSSYAEIMYAGILDLLSKNTTLAQIMDDYTLYVAYNSSGQDIVWVEPVADVRYGYIELNKTSANPAITNGNNCYALEGAVYGIYSDSNCTNQVTTLTTDKNGYAKSEKLEIGDYWIKEISASRGYMVDTAAHAVTVTAEQTATVNVTEQPANDPVGITLTKIAGDGVLNTSSLAGAQFTIKFYAGQYSSTSQLPSAPTRTWVIQTQSVMVNGKTSYIAVLDNRYKVAGDNFFYNADGSDVILPLGTLTIQETKAAEDYTLNGGWLNTNSGASVSSNGGVILLNVTQDGITGGGYIKGGNYYTKTDHSLNPGQAVSKLASKTTGATFNATSGRYDGTKNPGIYDAYEQVVFTLTVSNTGDQTLFNVNLDDDISDFAAYVYNSTFGYTTADGNTFLRAGDTLTTTKGNQAKITNVSFSGNTYSITLDRLAVGDSVKLYASCILFSDDGDHYNLENTVHLTSQYDCTGGNSSTNKLKTTPDTIKNGDNHSWDRDWINLRAHGSVKLTKYGSNGKTPLEGVTFALLDADGKTVQEVTTGADGVALWENLPLRSYSIVETQTVSGATLLKDPITFTLPLQMSESEAASTGADTTGILKTGNTFYFYDLTYEVRNNPTLTLPRTGGSDTAVWIAGMAGCAAVLAAAAVFVSTTRRRKAE